MHTTETPRPSSTESAPTEPATPTAAPSVVRLGAEETKRTFPPRRRLADEQEREVTRLYAETATPVAQIGQQFGIGESSVYRIAQRNGAALRGRTPASTPTAAAPAETATPDAAPVAATPVAPVAPAETPLAPVSTPAAEPATVRRTRVPRAKAAPAKPAAVVAPMAAPAPEPTPTPTPTPAPALAVVRATRGPGRKPRAVAPVRAAASAPAAVAKPAPAPAKPPVVAAKPVAAAGSRRLAAPKTAPATGAVMRFRIRFNAETVVEAADIRAALSQADSLGATEVNAITREG